MPRKKKIEEGLIKKENVWIAVFVALVIGFIGGVAYSSFMTKERPTIQPVEPPHQTSQDQNTGNNDAGLRFQALEVEASLNPKNADVWIQLGNIYFDNNMYEKSIGAYKKSLEFDPLNANVWTDLGVMYRRSGKPAEAVKAFDSATAVDPGHEISQLNKGIVLMHDLNEREKAIRVWEDLLKKNPSAVTSNGQPLRDMVNSYIKNTTR